MVDKKAGQDWRDKQFEQADFSKEYGVLAYTFEEIQRATAPATTAMQNYVATRVVEKFQNAYNQYVSSYDPQSPQNVARTSDAGKYGNIPLGYSEYFARNRGAYLDVLSQPIDLNPGRSARQPNGGATPGDLFPSALRQDTVGGAMNWLTMTEVPGMLTSLARPIYGQGKMQEGPDGKLLLDDLGYPIPTGERGHLLGRQMSNLPSDEINAGWMNGYDNIHNYQPTRADNGANSFTVWFNGNVAKGIEAHRKSESNWKSDAIPMTYAEANGGDAEGNSVLDMASEIGNVSRFQNISIRPEKSVWGINWNVAGGQRNNVSDFIAGLQNKVPGDLLAPYGKMNMQTGRVEPDQTSGAYGRSKVSGWLYGYDNPNYQVFGVDPNSAAGKAGMKQGAFIQSLQRLFDDPKVADVVDEFYQGTSFNLSVIQGNGQGKLIEQILNVVPGSMSGRGIDESQKLEEPHFIERIADQISNPIPTSLYTTDPRYASGMYQNEAGDWALAPMQKAMEGNFNVPVRLTRESAKRFIPLYDDLHEKWTNDDKLFQQTYDRAYETQLNRFLGYRRKTGKGLDLNFLGEVRQQALKFLPRTVPQPGTEAYTKWRSGMHFLGEIRSFEDTVERAPASGDFWNRTIEQWDAWTSGLQRYTNDDQDIPLTSQYVDPKAMNTFALGSMDEDDWDYKLRGKSRLNRPGMLSEPSYPGTKAPYPRSRREGREPRENTFDESIYNADPGSVEYEGVGDPERPEPYIDYPGLSYDRVTQEPIYNLSASDVNARAIKQASAYAAKHFDPKRPDRLIEARDAYDEANPIREDDRDLKDVSDAILQNESELNYARAWEVLNDPNADDASFSALVSSAGNEKGFLAHSKVSWKDVFNLVKKREKKNESNATFHALNNVEKSADEDSRELAANYDTLLQGGRKRSIMLSRLGERDLVLGSKSYGYGPDFVQEIAREVVNGRKPAERYRQTLQQIARESKINLSWQPGKEAELYDELEALNDPKSATYNPDAYQRVKSIYATPAEQLALSKQYVEKATTVPGNAVTGRTSQPRRGDSHTNTGPGGRSQAKYSSNQLDEMRRGRNTDPVTGEFDPFALENTPVSAQLRASNGGYAGNSNGLTSDQNKIFYRREDEAKIGRQIDYFMTHDYEDGAGRNLFNYIVKADASPDFLATLHAQTAANFLGRDLEYGAFSDQPDDTLPPGFKKIGGFLDPIQAAQTPPQPAPAPAPSRLQEYLDGKSKGTLTRMTNAINKDMQTYGQMNMSTRGMGGKKWASNPEAALKFDAMSELANQMGYDVGAPSYLDDNVSASLTPHQAAAGGGSNGSGGGGNTTTTPADANGTPQPARGSGNTPRPQPNSNPADFPMTPGAEGWKMKFSRYNPKTGKGTTQTAYGRTDNAGNLGWHVKNKDGVMEPLQINKGFGEIYNEKGELTHKLSLDAREYYDNMNAPLADPNAVSSAGNQTGTPARNIIRTPEEWAAFDAPVGTMMLDKSNGNLNYRFRVDDPDAPGERMWQSSQAHGAIPHRISDPGYGVMTAGDGTVLADVPRDKYEQYANETGAVQSAENKRLHDEAKAEGEKRQAEIKAERAAALATPPPSRGTGHSRAFGKFSNKMFEIAGNFRSRFEAAHSPTEFGEDEVGQATQLAGSNEYLAQVSHLFNSYTGKGNEPKSVEDLVEDITDLTGESDEKVRPIAEELFKDHEIAKRTHNPLKPQKPMARTLARVMRLDDEYDTQGVGIGPSNFRSHAASKVRDVTLGDIHSFKSPSLGEGGSYPYIDDKGETRMVPSVAIERQDASGKKSYETTVNQNEVAQGFDMAQKAFSTAMAGSLPTSPDSILATIKERMYKSVSEQMKAEVADATKHGKDQVGAGIAAQVHKEIADHFTTKIVAQVKDALGSTTGDTSGSLVGEGTRYDYHIKTAEGVAKKMAEDPKFAAEFRGRSAADVHSGDEMVVYDQDDRAVKVGASGGYGGSKVSSAGNTGPRTTNGAMGMFASAGKIGSLMYGAYMLKREWSMAAAPVLASAEKWGEGRAEYAQMVYSGNSLAETDMGFAYRQEQGENYMGKAAYSQFGGFMDIPYRLSQSGNMGAARMLQGAGIAAGVAMGGAITGSMLGMSGIAGLMAAAPAVATGGLVLGGMMLAGVGAMEAYNAWGKPEDAPDVTLTTGIDKMHKTEARARAATKRAASVFGDSYDDYQNKPGSKVYSDEKSWRKAKTRFGMLTFDNPLPDSVLEPFLDADGRATFTAEESNAKAAEYSKRIEEISGLTSETTDSLKKAMGMQKQIFGDPDGVMLEEVSRASALLGTTSDDSITTGASYAKAMGYIQGSPDFKRAAYQYATEKDRTKRSGMEYSASKIAGMGSQFQAMMGADPRYEGQGARIAKTYNFQTQTQAGAYSSMVQGLQAQGVEFAPWRYDQMANLSQQMSPVVSGVVGSAMEMYAGAGGQKFAEFGFALSSVGMSNQDATTYGRMLQGDMGAYSHMAWQSGNMDNAFMDQAGRSITQYNGAIANQVYNHWAPKLGLGQKTASQFLGTDNKEILAAWNKGGGDGGFYGLQMLSNEKSYAASMASIGIQLKGIALTENFNWGSNAGGTWDNPTAGSSWGIQNRQNAMQDASARANFADQWTRMTMTNDFSIQREANQAQRMAVSQQYQTFQFSQSYNQFQQQQVWAQQDWQTQDSSRQMQFGWQMEDLNEAIRFSSGRERKQLVKQRERLSTTESLEGDQIDTQRDRQKQLWAQQEESFQKQKQYTADLKRLDQESFNQNKQQREAFFKLDTEGYNRRLKEYEEEKKLSDELRDLQRKHEYEQLQLQKQAAGAQAAAAAAQYEINKAQIEGQKNWEELTGRFQEMNTYNTAWRVMNATSEMLKMADGVSTYKIQRIAELLQALSSTNTSDKWGGERE